METVTCDVRDLDAGERSAMERLVGHQLDEGQQIVIQVKPAPKAGPKLPDWCNVYEGLTDEQVDELDRAIVRSYSSRAVE